MADFGSEVGIQFTERASGHAAGGISDPQVAERLAAAGGGAFQVELRVAIPKLAEFLAAPSHDAEIVAGEVSWKPDVTGTPVLPGGRVAMFRNVDSSRKHKVVEFRFSFAIPAGDAIDCTAVKDLRDDSGFDAGTDLTTLRVTLESAGSLVGTGIARADILEMLRQTQSCTVTGARSKGEERAARQAYLGFLNGQLRDVYEHLPLLFKDTTQLTPEQRKTLTLCAQILLPAHLPPEGPTLDDVMAGLDRYLANASWTQLATITGWLQAIGTFLPPQVVGVGLLRMLISAELNKTERSPIRDVLQLIHTLVVFPYWAHPKADALAGYRRPSHESRNTPDLPVLSEPPDRVFDVAIAGSGPAGTLLAQRLSAQGKSVVLLEAGPYVPERTIDADEILWTARLYMDSALQQANSATPLFGAQAPSFMVLQGACLGGGGIINNAVCFRLPEWRLRRWQAAGFPVAAADLDAAYTRVAAEIGIKPASEAVTGAAGLNPTWKFLTNKLGNPGKPPLGAPPAPGLCECLVNLEDCRATGLCNVGCGSERKRNGVQVYLRQAAAAGCAIVDNAELVSIRAGGGTAAGERAVESFEVRLRGGRQVTVRAKEFVVSCGPVGSSVALLRSPDLAPHIEANRIPVGRRFSANLGSPVFAFCRERVNERPGLQIAHYYSPAPDDGFVIETWFNPPGANAMAMPGFQQAHFDRMLAYSKTVIAAPLVGSEASGTVSLDWQGRRSIELPVSGLELGRLRRGLVLVAEAFLAGGVEYAVVGLGSGRRLQTAADLAQFDRDLQDIEADPGKAYLLRMGTGHPQGGNAMSGDPQIGVIDERFLLRGFRNLRVCDGSVFPESAGVNPQWTIMSLAHECARLMEDS